MDLKVETIEPRPRSEILSGRLCGSLEVSIEVVDGLHIGTGGFSFKAENKILNEFLSRYDIDYQKLGELENKIFSDFFPFSSYLDGRIVIPASSVKGNVRSRLQLSFRGERGTVKSCFIVRREDEMKKKSWRHGKIWEASRERRIVQRHEGTGKVKELEEQCEFKGVCLLCDLFGTTGLAGIVKFSDFVGEEKKVRMENKRFEHGIKLSVATPPSTFKGKISFFNLEKHEIGLLLLGMGMKDTATGRPVLMGRLKYRGKIGKVQYRLEALELSPLSFPLVVGEFNVQPGQRVPSDRINKLVEALVKEAEQKFGTFQVVDEVEKLKEVLASGRPR